MAQQKVRVRIPPSPTGNLHVGTARTALFNEFFARSQGGVVILRFEDTDRARSKPDYEQNILEGLQWLGLIWDEGPFRQSERGELYQKELARLLAEGKVYKKEGEEAVRLKVEPQEVVFEDVVRGPVKTHTDSFGGDFVIARSVTDPLYHLAVVVDDAQMEITHVIRGEDHISNTARQILLQRALGYPTPHYAHVPLLVDEKRRKLSKRAGDTDLLSYRDNGYLPEALLNYLALLGWNPKTDQEFFTHDELVKAFSLEGIQKGSAAFSLLKLNSINQHYIGQLSPAVLFERTKPFLEQAGIDLSNAARLKAALVTEQARVATLAALPEAIRFFLPGGPGDYPAERLIWRKSTLDAAQRRLKLCQEVFEAESDGFSPDVLQKKMLDWIDAQQLGRGETLWPLRVALTGREHSPGPFEVAAVLGKEDTIRRISAALAKISP